MTAAIPDLPQTDPAARSRTNALSFGSNDSHRHQPPPLDPDRYSTLSLRTREVKALLVTSESDACPRRYSRNASLTAASSANAPATSSARRTTRSRSRYRAAYLPRTTPRIERKSYSDRSLSSTDSVSSGEVAIFVVSPFTSARLAGTDDPHSFATIRMRHQQQPAIG